MLGEFTAPHHVMFFCRVMLIAMAILKFQILMQNYGDLQTVYHTFYGLCFLLLFERYGALFYFLFSGFWL